MSCFWIRIYLNLSRSFLIHSRSSFPDIFCNKRVLKNFANSQENVLVSKHIVNSITVISSPSKIAISGGCDVNSCDVVLY